MANRTWTFLAYSTIWTFTLCRASARASDATCQDSYIWAYNSHGQSPCTVSAYLQGQCTSGVPRVPPLLPDHYYSGPNVTQSENRCLCNSIVYSLISACASCQLGSYLPWSKWTVDCKAVYLNVLPILIPPETDVPGWAYTLDPETSDSFNVTAARNFAASNGTSLGAAIPKGISQNRGMSPAVSGVIGAACTFVLVLSVGVGVFAWRRRARHRVRTGFAAERSSHRSFYKTQPVTATSSYVGLRDVSIDDGSRTPGHGPPLTLKTEHSIDLIRPTANSVYRNDSSLSLPDNLYMPVAMEASPAAESSRVCTTPGGLTCEPGAPESAAGPGKNTGVLSIEGPSVGYYSTSPERSHTL